MTIEPTNRTERDKLLVEMQEANANYHSFLNEVARDFTISVKRSDTAAEKINVIRNEINRRLNTLARQGMRDEHEQLFDVLQKFDGACAEWRVVLSAFFKRISNAPR